MRPIAYLFLAAISAVGLGTLRVGTGALARPSRAQLGSCQRPRPLSVRHCLLGAGLVAAFVMSMIPAATAETRPHYGGTCRGMLYTPPNAPDLPASAPPTGHAGTV